MVLPAETSSTMLHPVILSGGSGTRLWPLSRENYPKQLLCLTGKQTLLQQTVSRLGNLENVAPPVFVCNEAHRFLVAEQMRELGRAPADIILEPAGRNTAPALTLAALALRAQHGDALMLMMPADHVIQDTGRLHEALRTGMQHAAAGRLVTFGIVPTSPETGYGYIRKGKGDAVAAFVEKPDAETARQYLESGDYYWNSGIFMMPASAWLTELERLRPDILAACTNAYSQGSWDGDFYRVGKDAFLDRKSVV